MKVKIKRVRGGSMGGQRDYGLVTGSIWNYELKPDTNRVGDTLSPVPREDANIEAERGETIVGDLNNDGMVEHAIVGGKRHFEGGTPLNVPDGSFVFSDYNKLKIKNKDLLSGIFNYKTGKGATPAQVAKRYELNKYIEILNDPESDPLDKKTAQLMLDNNMKKLGQLALVQEGMKGFPDGIPNIALPLFGSDLQQQPKPQRMKKGGIVKYQAGRQVPSVFVPMPPSPYTEMAQMQAQYPGNWLPEVTVEAPAPMGYNVPINQYIKSVETDPRFKGWRRATGDRMLGQPVTESLTGYLPGATPDYEKTYIGGNPADMVTAVGVGTLLGYGPQLAKAGYEGLVGMGMPRWPGFAKAAKNVWGYTKEGAKYLGPQVAKLVTTPGGRTLIGTGASLGYQMYRNKGSQPVFTDEEVYGTGAPTQPEVDEFIYPMRNEFQEQRLREQQSKVQPAQKQATPARKRPASTAKPSIDREAIRAKIAEVSGMDPADVTDEMIDNYQIGGSTLPIHQSKGVTGPSFNVLDKDVLEAAAAKELEAIRPYTYYNPNIPVIGSQLTTSGKYMVTPQGVIWRKGQTPVNIDELKQYPVDWSSYGPGGFEDFKKDIAAAGGKESAASKWWVDKVNEYAVKTTGKPIFDISQKGVYVPGYEWSTPAFFKERAKKETPAAAVEEEKKTEPTEVIPPRPGFQGKVRPRDVGYSPEDKMGILAAAMQRTPQYMATTTAPTPTTITPPYLEPDYAPELGAYKTAAESVGTSPAGRNALLGVTGKVFEAIGKKQQANKAANLESFFKAALANQQEIAKSKLYRAEEDKAYIDRLNQLEQVGAMDENAKMAQMIKTWSQAEANRRKLNQLNAMFPYQYSDWENTEANPILSSTSQTPLLGNTGSSNLDTLWQSKFDSLSKIMTRDEAAKAATEYLKAINSSSRGNQGSAYSPFDLMS